MRIRRELWFGFGLMAGFRTAFFTVNVFSGPTCNHADRDVLRTKSEYR